MKIIYPPTIDWDWMVQRPQQICRRLAERGLDVFYCNATQRPWLPPEKLSQRLTIIHDFQKYIQAESIDQDTVFWVSWPGHCELIGRLCSASGQKPIVIYDAVDDFPEWRKYVDAMVELCDAIVTSSQPLYERYVSYGKPVTLIRNGADFALFNQVTKALMPVPKELAAVDGPVVGFLGALGPWIDVKLLTALAEEGLHGGWKVVLVGPPFGAPLPREAPIISVGRKPYQVLPEYVARFNACILPFAMTPTSIASNPIKLYDYLATGKPVIATPIPEVLILSHLVFVAEDAPGFIELVRHALRNPKDGMEQRIAFARANSWESRVDQVVEVIRASGMAKTRRIY
ncbi:MAG TPA: glycosyltransferase family 1 protein [Firmicutes bacterium]|nr:glycosyltransferase family 1 protein [Bacillota bacterium]